MATATHLQHDDYVQLGNGDSALCPQTRVHRPLCARRTLNNVEPMIAPTFSKV